VIALTQKEEQLVQTIRSLPEGSADQILLWASRLSELAAGGPVDWSDSWTDEDMRDAEAASLQRFEERPFEAHPTARSRPTANAARLDNAVGPASRPDESLNPID
jgi:hypothetical protein